MQVNLSEKNQTINKNQGKPKRQKIEFPRKKKKITTPQQNPIDRPTQNNTVGSWINL
jgi:hypothetical protein